MSGDVWAGSRERMLNNGRSDEISIIRRSLLSHLREGHVQLSETPPHVFLQPRISNNEFNFVLISIGKSDIGVSQIKKNPVGILWFVVLGEGNIIGSSVDRVLKLDADEVRQETLASVEFQFKPKVNLTVFGCRQQLLKALSRFYFIFKWYRNTSLFLDNFELDFRYLYSSCNQYFVFNDCFDRSVAAHSKSVVSEILNLLGRNVKEEIPFFAFLVNLKVRNFKNNIIIKEKNGSKILVNVHDLFSKYIFVSKENLSIGFGSNNRSFLEGEDSFVFKNLESFNKEESLFGGKNLAILFSQVVNKAIEIGRPVLLIESVRLGKEKFNSVNHLGNGFNSVGKFEPP